MKYELFKYLGTNKFCLEFIRFRLCQIIVNDLHDIVRDEIFEKKIRI